MEGEREKGESKTSCKPPFKTCTSIHYQNHARMRPKHQIKYHKNNTARLASKHPNHTTAPSYHNTHKNSYSNVVARHLVNHPSKHALQYTIKITRACVQNAKSNITKITPPASHQNIPTIPHRHLTITLTKTHIPTSSHDIT